MRGGGYATCLECWELIDWGKLLQKVLLRLTYYILYIRIRLD